MATSLEPTDVFVISRLGVGTLNIEAADISGGLEGTLITANGVQLQAGGLYAVKTSLGAFSGQLPQLSSVTAGVIVEVSDADYDAGTNPYTVNAFAGDAIADHASSGSSYVINISNTISRFTANNNGTWRVITYGS